jgi:hypothetical protein
MHHYDQELKAEPSSKSQHRERFIENSAQKQKSFLTVEPKLKEKLNPFQTNPRSIYIFSGNPMFLHTN